MVGTPAARWPMHPLPQPSVAQCHRHSNGPAVPAGSTSAPAVIFHQSALPAYLLAHSLCHSSAPQGESQSQKETSGLKCLLVNERSQSEKATYGMTPPVGPSGKGKTMQTVRGSVVARGWGRQRDGQSGHRQFLGYWEYCSQVAQW